MLRDNIPDLFYAWEGHAATQQFGSDELPSGNALGLYGPSNLYHH